MARTKLPLKDILDLLNGCEVQSIEFEGTVGYYKGQWWVNGRQINPTEKQIRKLYNDYFIQEFGPNWKAELRAEFASYK